MLIQERKHLFTCFLVFEFENPFVRIVIEDIKEPTSLGSGRLCSAKNCTSYGGNEFTWRQRPDDSADGCVAQPIKPGVFLFRIHRAIANSNRGFRIKWRKRLVIECARKFC